MKNNFMLMPFMADNFFNDFDANSQKDFFNFNNFFDNIEKTEDGYVIEIDVPGFSKDEIEVSEADGLISIKAEKKENSKRQSIFRTYKYNDLDTEKINVKLENGVLSISAPFKNKNTNKRLLPII